METLNERELDARYRELNDQHNNLYQFVLGYNDFIYSLHDYGHDTPLTMIEVHTLTYIEEHPSTTVTELAAYWHKTKSALSQLVTWLAKQGLVEKRRREDNARVVGLYPTERGIEISREHKRFDIADIERTNTDLLQTCSQEEIDAFYKVLGSFNELIRRDFEINAGRRGR